jgi:hypothetical protein
MKRARLEPSEATSRPIYESLCRAKKLPSQAFKILQNLSKDGESIPTAAVNVVLEASIAHGNLKEAVELYKSLHEICPSGPNTATFNTLLQGCSKSAGNKDLAMFLASEMAALGIRPNVLTYDRLVLVCLTEEDYNDAFLYLEEMTAMFEGCDMRMGTWNLLVRKCVEARDERAWSILDDMQSRGLKVERIRRWAEEAWRGASASLREDGGKIDSDGYKARMQS